MDQVTSQPLRQYRQAGLIIIMVGFTPGLEIREQPGQRRLVDGAAIAAIHVARRPSAFRLISLVPTRGIEPRTY